MSVPFRTPCISLIKPVKPSYKLDFHCSLSPDSLLKDASNQWLGANLEPATLALQAMRLISHTRRFQDIFPYTELIPLRRTPKVWPYPVSAVPTAENGLRTVPTAENSSNL